MNLADAFGHLLTAFDALDRTVQFAADTAPLWGLVASAGVVAWAADGWRQRARRREMARRVAAETARREAGWAADAAGGDGWAVDLEAQDALYAHIDAAEDLELCEQLWAMPAYDSITEEEGR